jgi:hypothetical protein
LSSLYPNQDILWNMIPSYESPTIAHSSIFALVC